MMMEWDTWTGMGAPTLSRHQDLQQFIGDILVISKAKKTTTWW